MIAIMRTNDLVLITAVEAILRSERIEVLVADQHMSCLEGSAGFLPRRILVESDYAARARRILTEAGMEAELLRG